MPQDIEERAIRFTMGVLRTAHDWQDGQHALADHDEFGPWIAGKGDEIAECQRIIRAAEERLGADLPY
jgi:hypothetical protein